MRERARENRRFALNKNEQMQNHFFISKLISKSKPERRLVKCDTHLHRKIHQN